jgi:SAM-dependent methyltransferase
LKPGIYFSVFALSAAALILESSLTRLLAVAQYYHFAFLVVSLALLGFGASGSLLAISKAWIPNIDREGDNPGRGRILALSAVGFASSLMIAYLVVNWLPFDSYSIAWNKSQVLLFALYYLVLSLPFLFAGLGIGVVLSSSSGRQNRVYAVNLLGSAFGIVIGLFAMQFAGVPGALVASGVISISAALGLRKVVPRFWRGVIWIMVASGILGLLLLSRSNLNRNSRVGLAISPYKGLPYALQVPDAEQVFGSWNAISRIDVVAKASTHVLPGLSYVFAGQLPEQLGMAFDGDALRPLTLTGPDSFQAADFLPESAAFLLHQGANTLVLDAGSGLGILQALAVGATRVVATQDNPLVVEASAATAGEFDIFHHEQVELVPQSPREFLASTDDHFDVILLPLNDAYRPIANGAYSLSENYDLTVEGFENIFTRLSPDGILVLSRWLQTPPSESLRVWGTILETFFRTGIEDPGSKLVAYRGIQTMTILVKPGGWSSVESEVIRDFTEARKYDLVWIDDLKPEEVNRFNQLEQDQYHETFQDLLTADSKEKFFDGYPYAVRPITDNGPFFFHFFKGAQTPQILATFGRVWQPFGGSGYFVLVALLILVSLFSILLILVPLRLTRIKSTESGIKIAQELENKEFISPGRIVIYFGSIGVAFLCLEIPLIQRSILSLGHPAYAFALVVLVLLVASSLGSLLSRRYWHRRLWVMGLLSMAAFLTPFLFYWIQGLSLGWPISLRVICLGAGLVPLGVLMGFPFPTGLEWLERANSNLIPWAWAVNGCASVIGAVLAAIASLSVGFSAVLLVGALFYGVAAVTLRT